MVKAKGLKLKVAWISGDEVFPAVQEAIVEGKTKFENVTALLDEIFFEQIGTDRVALRGVRGALPPPTTKIGLTAKGGFQAESHWFLCGLDIEEKARMLGAQIRHLLKPHSHNFSKLQFTLNGTVGENARDQNAATVDFRVFVQAAKESDIAPGKFLRNTTDGKMQGYPGATIHMDMRQDFPKSIYEYYVTLLPQSAIEHKVHLWNGQTLNTLPPPQTKTYPAQQPSETEAKDVTSVSWAKTVRGPLGRIVHARSGDKGSNANVGLWVKHRDEWDWLRSLLFVATIKDLLGMSTRTARRL